MIQPGVTRTSNELSENRMKETITYLGINLTTKLKELYSKNLNTLMKEIEDANK